MNINTSKIKSQWKPTVKSAGRFILITALTYGPGGIAGFAVKAVARRPIKIALGLVLEPILKRVISKIIAPVLKHTENNHNDH